MEQLAGRDARTVFDPQSINMMISVEIEIFAIMLSASASANSINLSPFFISVLVRGAAEDNGER